MSELTKYEGRKRERTTIPGTGGLKINRESMALVNEVVRRSTLAQYLGQSYGGNRNIYSALGYPLEINYGDYLGRYLRHDVGRRVVVAPVRDTWRIKPAVTDDDDSTKRSVFEKAWDDLVKEHRIWNRFIRVDRLAGIGQFAILYCGFSDVTEEPKMKEPVTVGNGLKLQYVQPFSQGNVTVSKLVTDPTDERFGLPEIYQVQVTETTATNTTGTSTTQQSKTLEIHHSRVIHVAEELDESNYLGTPRMRAVWNRLQDIELVSGGSSEMFWRGAFMGLALEADKDADMTKLSMADLQDEVDEYVNGMKRTLQLQGVEAKQLGPQIESPKDNVEVLLLLISAGTGIPVRILVGSERGELASSQDERNWASLVTSRQEDFAEPIIMRPFTDMMIKYKILPTPQDGDYDVDWASLYSLGEKEQADVIKIKTEALAAYSNAMTIEEVMPSRKYLEEIWGMSKAEIDEMQEEIKKFIDDENRQTQDTITAEQLEARLAGVGGGNAGGDEE